MEEEIIVTRRNAKIPDEIKLKNRLTRTFGKLSHFLQCLGGSSYRELTEKTLNERTRWNKSFFQVGLWGWSYIFFQKFSFKKNIWFAGQFTWCTSRNKQGALLKKKISRFSHLLLLLLCTVYPFFLFYYHSIAIR